jgi:hypothetical protein
MARIAAAETDGIACWRLNRFARNVAGAIEDVKAIQAAGGSLAFVEEDIDPTGPFGSFVLTVLLAVATLERDNLVTGWKTAKSRAVERGVPIGPTPFGYLRGDDATLQVDPDTAPHVTEAFRIAAKDGHVATLDHMAKVAPDKPWTTTTLRRLISNRVYLGEVRWSEMVTRDAHDALTDRATWERAQLPEAVRRRQAQPFPLSGIAHCAGCGERLVGARGGNDNRRMYRCRAGLTTWRGERCPAPVSITATFLEGHVLDEVEAAYRAAKRKTRLEVRSPETSDEGRLQAAEAAMIAAEDELARFASDATAADVLGEAAWQTALRARADRHEAVRQAYRAEAESTRSATVELPIELLRTLEPSELAGVLGSAITSLTVRKGRGQLHDRVRLKLDSAHPRIGVAAPQDPTSAASRRAQALTDSGVTSLRAELLLRGGWPVTARPW